MKRALQTLTLAVFVCFSTSWSCGQNGPTPPRAVATWTQAVPTASSGPVTANSVYRCSPAPCVPGPPAVFTSVAAITTWTDTSISGGPSYVYAVTAHFGTVESPYSNPSTPYTWAYSAPTFDTVTSSLVPMAQAQDVVAKVVPVKRPPICKNCSTVSDLRIVKTP